MDEINAKQRIFVAEYILTKNATKAAIKAGYSEKTAQEQGSRLLSNVIIQAEINRQLREQEQRTLITADKILMDLYTIATADIRTAYNDDGSLKPVNELPEGIARCIQSVDTKEIYESIAGEKVPVGQIKTVKFWDKVKSLELLGKHLKLFTDRIEVEVNDPLAERLKKARERAKSKSE